MIMRIIEVGNGSRHTRKSTWDDGYTAHPIILIYFKKTSLVGVFYHSLNQGLFLCNGEKRNDMSRMRIYTTLCYVVDVVKI